MKLKAKLLTFSLAGSLLAPGALGNPSGQVTPIFAPAPRLSLRANVCADQAALHHRVNPDILKAILLVESGGKPLALNRNANGTLDIGVAQINSIHLQELSRFGIRAEHLFDECISAFVAAWHYARQIRLFGNTWKAVGAYHSRTPSHNVKYQRKVYRTLLTMRPFWPAQAYEAPTHSGWPAPAPLGTQRFASAEQSTSFTSR